MAAQDSLQDLQHAAQKVKESQSPQEKSEALVKAFEIFSKETQRLEIAYNSLKEKFARVNRELEETNTILRQKIAELDSTKNYLEKILGNMAQGLLFVDFLGTIITYNSTAETILEKPRERVLGRPYVHCFSDHTFGFSLSNALQKGKTPSFTQISYETATTKKDLEIETTFLQRESSAQGEVDGMIILIRDITEIRKLQIIANRNERMKVLGEMAAMVAHEIRNPLGGIKGFASLLARDLKDQPEMQNMASQIIEGTDSMNKLVTNVLNYSRPMQVELESNDLICVTKEAIEHIKMDSVLTPSISLTSSFPDHPISAMIDPQLFKSALLNLMVNGIHAMPNGGELKIIIEENPHEAFIKIADTGEGIASENLEKIFRPFFTTKPRGHGFGLAEVHRVIQEHNGLIDVTSKIGQGTTFTISLPLQKRKLSL